MGGSRIAVPEEQIAAFCRRNQSTTTNSETNESLTL